MKVICINNENGIWGIAKKILRVSEEYTVTGNPLVNPDGYLLKEVQHPNHPNIGFKKERFIPLSDIDEKEFERNYNKVTA